MEHVSHIVIKGDKVNGPTSMAKKVVDNTVAGEHLGKRNRPGWPAKGPIELQHHGRQAGGSRISTSRSCRIDPASSPAGLPLCGLANSEER